MKNVIRMSSENPNTLMLTASCLKGKKLNTNIHKYWYIAIK